MCRQTHTHEGSYSSPRLRISRLGAMAGPSLACLLLLLGSAASSSAQLQAVGGTDTFTDFANALLQSFRRLPGAYQKVGSTAGITNFNGGGTLVAISDTPISGQEATAAGTISQRFGKLTIPLVIGTYSFFVGAPRLAKVNLTAMQTWEIYSLGGTWRQYNQPVAGPIVRFARGDNSGANFIIKSYWRAGANAPVALDDTALVFPDIVYVTGAQAMCQGLLQKPGGIAYSLTGLCLPLVQTGKVVEVYMQQGKMVMDDKGPFIRPSLANPLAAIPKVLPASNMPWTNVPGQMILSKAAKAPPIVVFVYSFIRQRGLRFAGRSGAAARLFMVYAVKTAPLLARQYGYLPLPPAIQAKNIAALHTVKLF